MGPGVEEGWVAGLLSSGPEAGPGVAHEGDRLESYYERFQDGGILWSPEFGDLGVEKGSLGFYLAAKSGAWSLHMKGVV